MAAFPEMLEQDRKRSGFSVGQAARRLGERQGLPRDRGRAYAPPSFETWDRIGKLFGWPQTFVEQRS